MGLTSALNISNSGLRMLQTGLNTVANNVAQADVEGYRRQELSVDSFAKTGGVTSQVARAADNYLEGQYRIETARTSAAEVNDYYMSRIDQLFGQPGEAGSLDGLLNSFNQSLEGLATSPDDFTVRRQVLASAENMANKLNGISEEIQALRQNAEDGLASELTDVTDALEGLQDLNQRLAGAGDGSAAKAELLNERDSQIGRLADAMEIRVSERDDGSVAIYSKSGNTLLEGMAVTLEFDHQGNLNASKLYDADEEARGVGTVTLKSTGGYELDLINNGGLDTGRVGALIEMRDEALVEAQAQLDELAAGLAAALSSIEVDGSDVTSGAASGQDINLDNLQQGNSISLSYSENGQEKSVTIVRVDDPSLLPLSDDHTATAGDRVIGVDFSQGYAAAATAINAELSPAVSVSANADGLRFLDDGAAGTSDINSVSSSQTLADAQSGHVGLALFVDGAGDKPYTGAMEGIGQKQGFASRISVSSEISANSELLVKYDGSTDIGNTDRPLALIDRLNEAEVTFSPQAGIGATGSPYTGSVMDYASAVISDQTGKADNAAQAYQSQQIVSSAIETRLAEETSVNIDEELTRLIDYQNSYAANARIIAAVDEMYDQLMRMV